MSTSALPVSSIPLFGRKYSLSVQGNSTGGQPIEYSNSDWEPEALRITFDYQSVLLGVVWWADIGIFNLTSASTSQLLSSVGPGTQTTSGTPPIQQGDQVTLNAGYQAGQNYGLVFQGSVFQPMWDKPTQVDYRIRLRCALYLSEYMGQIVNTNFPGNISQLAYLKQLCQNAGIIYQSSQVSEGPLASVIVPRAQTVSSTPNEAFKRLADQHQMLYSPLADGSFVMKSIADLQNIGSPDFVYSPAIPVGSNLTPQAGINYTIQGTPQQTENGVIFRVNLDPRIKVTGVLQKVQIQNAIIQQLATELGQSLIAPLAQTGTYYVCGVRHVGDSRGEDWYTEILGVTPLGLMTMANLAPQKPGS
jgi:hypothetical protein